MSRERSFAYRPQTKAELERRVQIGRFPEALRSAYRSDIRPLAEYFNATMPKEHADAFNEFLKRRLRWDCHRTRPPETEAVHDAAARIAFIAQWEIELVRRQNGGTVPNGTIAATIQSVWERLAEDGELDGVDHDELDARFYAIIKAAGRKRKWPKKPSS